jgi:Putative phage tail protein
MNTINTVKELEQADTPLLLFECVLSSGDTERWSSSAITWNGHLYSARVLKHNLFDLQLSADDAMDGISQLSLTLANADSILSEIQAEVGLKGARLTVYFVFVDLTSGTVTTESSILFRGIAGDPDLISEDSLKVTFTNKLSLQRVAVPDIRIQRQCPWSFPATAEQRASARDSSNGNKYSTFYRCGYAPDQIGGRGNLNGAAPFQSCDYTRTGCGQRGMFSTDTSGNVTRRFGGIEFVPSAYLVRGFGQKTTELSAVQDNIAKYNDPVPVVYGTGWLKAPVVFGRNDGNLTHMEVLLGTGVMQGVLKVVVSDVEIPAGVAGQDMTSTGWYNPISNGGVTGSFNADFSDSLGNPLGDPYGSMTTLSIVVPNRINNGNSLPTVQVLIQGLLVDRYGPDGAFLDTSFTNNPAWIILDILRRAGWALADLNLATFSRSAAYCDELISSTDLNGNPIRVARFNCNLQLVRRQSAAVVIRGIRVAAGLMLRYGANGDLELLNETAIATQQPALPDGSNSTETLAGGWPAYEFSDGTASFSGIARQDDGSSSVCVLSRSLAETSNRLSVEFQDETNEYQQDSLSLVDSDDTALIGYEISSTSTALGIPNFNQANRVLRRQIDKLTKGNCYIQFLTSFRALKVRPGDIITLTYAKEGLQRTPFRVTKLSPSLNYRMVQILAQIHDDNWYSDDPNVISGSGRQPGANVTVPRPLLGTTFDANGNTEFAIEEQTAQRADGGVTDTLSVSFVQPSKVSTALTNLPLLSLAPTIAAAGGTLPGGTNYYYAVTTLDADGNEGSLSFTVLASVPAGTATSAVTLNELSFPSAAVAFNAYRGSNPQLLFRIASNSPLSSTFTDTGFEPLAAGPPDPNYDHANFYYRLEAGGPFLSTASSSTTIANADMGATVSGFRGMLCRIIGGPGLGQERKIVANDQTTLTVSPAWSVLPDNTSQFVITEASWRFGAVSVTSPARFEVPNQAGTVIEISGRAANVHDLECSADLCPITRWIVGGGQGLNSLDKDVPPVPQYTVSALGAGDLQVSGIHFASLVDTESITAGTLQLVYRDELQPISARSLLNTVDAATTSIQLSPLNPLTEGDTIQIESEIMLVLTSTDQSGACKVVRRALGSTGAGHVAGVIVAVLNRQTYILPFAAGFFGNPASSSYVHTVHVPDICAVATQLYLTNVRGDGQAGTQCFLSPTGSGLRTLAGGQLSLQVSGSLAVQQNATPPLFIEASHSLQDLRATVGVAPVGSPLGLTLWQNSTVYCALQIAAGETSSQIVDGTSLPILTMGSSLRLDITAVPTGWQDSPGRDLTVTIRL